MKAYVISGVAVRDAEPLVELRKDSARMVKSYKGKVLAAGKPCEWIESIDDDSRPERIGIIEFPSLDAARRYVQSVEFQELTARRNKYADAFIIVVEGIDDPADYGR